MQYIRSCSIVSSRTIGATTDKFLSLGGAIMVRKFDESVIPSGSWHELWIGMRCRLNTHVDYEKPHVYWSSGNPSAIGICDTSGLVWGESGSQGHNISIINLNVGWLQTRMGWSASAVSPKGASPYSVGGSAAMYGFCTGSYTNSTNTFFGDYCVYPETTESVLRLLFLMRFRTSSNWETWGSDSIYTSSWSGVTATDLSSSSQLADIMSSPTWAEVTTTASAWGYNFNGSSGTVHADQAVNGYFNGIFIAWEPRFDDLEISDIVIRPIP